MDFYTFSLLLGGIGLAAMALSGFGHHGHGTIRGHTHGPGHAHSAGSAHHSGRTGPGHAHGAASPAARAMSVLMSPRIMFSALLGIGATGVLLRHLLGGLALLAAAIAGGLLFERLLVTPFWNLALRFASKPALTLESCISDEARAASGFDVHGQGLIEVELDGQVVQVLGTLLPADRLAGVKVRAGDRVRIEEVDTQRNRCTVSAL